MKLILWCLTLSILLIKIEAYFYEHNLTSLSGNAGSMFGYGIAHQHTATNKSFLVSAPTADQIGQIFKCSLNYYTSYTNYTCNQVTIDVKGKRESTEITKDVTYKHNFLLGVSLVSGSDYIITCAPRITNEFKYYKGKSQITIFGTFGKCYYLKDNSDHFIAMYSPDRNQIVNGISVEEKIMNSFGWSAHVSKKEQVFVGSPTMDIGRILYYSSIDTSPILRNATSETNAYNYGYSITSGNFLSKSKNLVFFAISSPYDTIGLGKIKLYSIIKNRIEPSIEKQDDVLGSIFGASMAAADLDGDGIDDLLVGAPGYQKLETHQWNIGAVNIYMKKLNKKKLLTGYASEGYFGSSIVNIGDQDGDGCDDICIGAPYEDRGVVYVYSGAVISKSNEKDIKWTQRIEAQGGDGFGLSLARLKNFENNGCSSLGVGAPDSDAVYIAHCIPMVTLTLETDIPYVHLLPVNTTSFDIKSCFNVKYSKKLQDVIADVVVKTKIEHDKAAVENPRVNETYFQYETSLKIDEYKYCTNVAVTIPEDGDYSQQLKYSIKAELKENAANVYPYNPFRVLLSPGSTLSDEGKISAARGCSNIENCVSVLAMAMHHNIPDYYMLGTTQTEDMYITMNSSGETAYSSCVRINIFGVSILKYPPSCEKDRNNETTLICSPLRPLYNNDTWNSGNILLDMRTLTSAHREIILTADLYYYCKMEKNDTLKNIIHLVTNTSGIEIKSKSSFDPVIKMLSSDFKIERKPVEHTFMITNYGRVTWEGLQANLLFDHVKYLKYTGIKVDNVKCDIQSHLEEGRTILVCPLPILNVNSSILISIQMDILLKNLENQLKDKNITLETTLNVDFEGTYINSSVSNILVYQKAGVVPFWIIIISSIIGLVVLLAIVFGMSEAGYFKRQHKEKLETLKHEVKRQSVIRQSVMFEVKQPMNPALPFQPISEDSIIQAKAELQKTSKTENK